MKYFYALFLIFFFIFGCKEKVELQAEKALLLKSNEIQRRAHMENNVNLLVSEMSDSVLTVQAGRFTIDSKLTIQEKFDQYFSTVKYYAWDDLEPPVIDVSIDGSLASVSVRKVTIAQIQDQELDTTYFAWTSSYKKVEGKWKIYKIASTRLPN